MKWQEALLSLFFFFSLPLFFLGNVLGQDNALDKLHLIYHCVYPILYKEKGETFVKEDALVKIWDILGMESKTVDSALLLEVYEQKDFEKAWPPAKLAQYSPEQTAMTKGRENILKLVDAFKRHKIPFWLAVYPPMGPAINPETLEAVYKSAGDLCRGIVFGESFDAGTLVNPLCWSTALQYVRITQKYDKKVVWIEHAHDGPITSWPWHYAYGKGWWGLLLFNDLFRIFFNGETRNTIVPCTESNDPRGEIYDLMAVLGIWQSGLVNEWGASIQNWFWHDMARMCKDINKPWSLQMLKDMGVKGEESMGDLLRAMPANLVLRFILMNASLGARYFEFESAEMLLDFQGEEIRPSPQFSKGIKPFIEMWEKGIVKIPKRDEILSLSPVAFKLTDVNAWYINEEGKFVGSWEKGTLFAYMVEDDGEFPPNYFFKFAYRPTHPLWYIPSTPYGMILFLPKDVPPSILSRFPYVFTTNLRDLWRGKETSNLANWETLKESLIEGRKRMVFLTDEVFLSSMRREGKYYLCLIAPDELNAKEMVAKIKINGKLGKMRVWDLLKGEMIKEGLEKEIDIILPKENFFSLLMLEPF
ncbi:MAG: hypothetical protein ACP5QS_01635 [bacterium]